MAHKTFILDGRIRQIKPFKGQSIADNKLLKSEFNIKKNNVDPKYISIQSNIKFYWKCNKGHESYTSPNSRYKKNDNKTKKDISGCAYCANQKVSKDNSLLNLNPEIAKLWNYEKNKILPSEITSGSQKKVWWKCEKGHEFEKTSSEMQRTNSYCGKCGRNGKYIKEASEDNCLTTLFPEIAKEWHPTKNGKLKPTDITATNPSKIIWWQCPVAKDHIYDQTSYLRTTGKNGKKLGCPFCAGVRVCKSNSFKYLFPEIAKEWHPTKNGKLKPTDVTAGSNKKIWWECKKKHIWQATPATRQNSGCKKCTGKGISYMEIRLYTELILLFKDIKWSYQYKGYQADLFIPNLNLAIEIDGYYWHRKENRKKFDIKKNQFFKKNNIHLIRVRENGLNLLNTKNDYNTKFFYNSKIVVNELLDQIVLFIDSKSIHKRINKYKELKVFQNNNSFRKICANLPAPIFENSLEYKHKEISEEWDYSKNFPLIPSMFKSSSNLLVSWRCKKNNHSFKATIGNRTILKRGCPFCAGRYATKDNNLKKTHKNLIKEWHPQLNGELKPEQFTPISGQYVWWICNKGHAYRKTIARRVKQKANCPCKLIEQNYTPRIFPLVRKEFNKDKNILDLSEYRIDDKRDVWWKCKKNHEYKKSIFRRTFYMERCPECKDDAMDFHKDLHQTIKT